MIRYFFCCATFLLALCMSAPVWADTIEATVTRITGSDLELTLADSRRQPKTGDSVDVFFSIPGGGRVSIGVWRITSVDGQKVSASVVSQTGQPMVGYVATIQTSQQKAPAISSEPPPPVQKAPTVSAPPPPPAQSAPAAVSRLPERSTNQLSAEEQQLIAQLRSANSADKRRAAMAIHRSNLGNKTLQAAVEEELLKGYAIRTRDKKYIDAMAWMCNVLGDSGDRRYSATLKRVYQGTRNRKVKKYAKANYQKLR